MLMADRLVILYSRPGCHLCDEAAAVLAQLALDLGFQFETVNVERDPTLEARYGQVLPVVAYAGEEVLRAPLGERKLRTALQSRLRV